MHIRRHLRRAIWGIVVVAALGSVSASLAAPTQQEAPTLTPTPTATETPIFVGPSPTPTETLLPPPQGGGRVAVLVLVVRFGPSRDWLAAGGLNYGDEVYPIARSANGNWVAIEWDSGIGWILASLVEWDPALDIASLPVYEPPFTSTPLGTATLTATEVPPTPSPTITAGPPTATAPPTATLTEAPSPTTLPPSPTTTTPSPTDTPVPAVVVPVSATPGESTAPVLQVPPIVSLLPKRLTPGIWIGGGIILALLAAYGARRWSREQELKRYSGGFILNTCPVCQEGTLQLEENVQRSLGTPRVQRTVRCDFCRSVLREVRPGTWRYTIDPFVNPQLADAHNAQQFTDEDLLELAGQARMYKPYKGEAFPAPEIDLDQSAMEIVSELEARFLAERAAEEAEAEETEQEETGDEDSGEVEPDNQL
jgi:hypothetical protein